MEWHIHLFKNTLSVRVRSTQITYKLCLGYLLRGFLFSFHWNWALLPKRLKACFFCGDGWFWLSASLSSLYCTSLMKEQMDTLILQIALQAWRQRNWKYSPKKTKFVIFSTYVYWYVKTKHKVLFKLWFLRYISYETLSKNITVLYIKSSFSDNILFDFQTCHLFSEK